MTSSVGFFFLNFVFVCLIARLQEHQPHGEHVRVGGHVRRRLAQLSPHVSLGLQERRAARLQAEPVHAVHRRVLADRLGVRPEDRARRTGEQTCPAHRRRYAQGAGHRLVDG